MMRVAARAIASWLMPLVILTFVMGITALSVEAQPASLKAQLIGHWQLAAVTVNNATPYGADPQGSMFLDGGGHFSVIVISAGDARNISYFGTYTVNDADKSMTMHIQASGGGSGIDATGRDVTRSITVNGDELIVQNTRRNDSGAKLTWKRAD